MSIEATKAVWASRDALTKALQSVAAKRRPDPRSALLVALWLADKYRGRVDSWGDFLGYYADETEQQVSEAVGFDAADCLAALNTVGCWLRTTKGNQHRGARREPGPLLRAYLDDGADPVERPGDADWWEDDGADPVERPQTGDEDDGVATEDDGVSGEDDGVATEDDGVSPTPPPSSPPSSPPFFPLQDRADFSHDDPPEPPDRAEPVAPLPAMVEDEWAPVIRDDGRVHCRSCWSDVDPDGACPNGFEHATYMHCAYRLLAEQGSGERTRFVEKIDPDIQTTETDRETETR